jgi:hypothetical protein
MGLREGEGWKRGFAFPAELHFTAVAAANTPHFDFEID